MKPEPISPAQGGRVRIKIGRMLAINLTAAVLLFDTVGAQPNVSPANRETRRIMQSVKIPPPYRPVYTPQPVQINKAPVNVVSNNSPKTSADGTAVSTNEPMSTRAGSGGTWTNRNSETSVDAPLTCKDIREAK